MRPCDYYLRRWDSTLLGAYQTIESVELRRSVDNEMEGLVWAAVADVKNSVEKEAKYESCVRNI